MKQFDRGVAVLALGLLALTGCSSSSPGPTTWTTLPAPSVPGATLVGGHGDGTVPAPEGDRTTTIGVSCAGSGTLTITGKRGKVGSVECYEGNSPNTYTLTVQTEDGDLKISAPSGVYWRIGAGST